MSSQHTLIVGASSVLGGAAAKCISSDGSGLLLTYNRVFQRDRLCELFPEAELFPLNVCDQACIASFGQMLDQREVQLTGVVYAAGVGLLRPFNISQAKANEEVMNVNVGGVLSILQSILPSLQRGEVSSVVVISSTMGLVGAPGMSVYATTKAALCGLVRALAVEWAPRGIRVNAVAPGIVPSPLVDSMFKHASAEQINIIRQRHPLGFGMPEDVGHAIAFLLSKKARWITGATLPVDGGYTAQ